jgi:hypothetical protein
MSKENPTWDVPRIASELALLGHDIAKGTVAKYMVRKHKPFVDQNDGEQSCFPAHARGWPK